MKLPWSREPEPPEERSVKCPACKTRIIYSAPYKWTPEVLHDCDGTHVLRWIEAP